MLSAPRRQAIEEKLMMAPPPSSRGKELRPQVDIERLVPVLDIDLIDFVPLVVGRVVDENTDRPLPPAHFLYGRKQRINIRDVAADESRAGFFGERAAGVVLHVDKADLAAVGRKGAHDIGADARRAAGHKDDTALEAWVSRVGGNDAPR
jgi:hypothetical protein